MAVKKATENDLRSLIYAHDMVIAIYLLAHCPFCKAISPFYGAKSEDSVYKDILFLKINASESPVAAKIVGANCNPFVIIYKKGFLLRCEEVKTEKKLITLLNKLKKEKLPHFRD